jgi:hypothetical protein
MGRTRDVGRYRIYLVSSILGTTDNTLAHDYAYLRRSRERLGIDEPDEPAAFSASDRFPELPTPSDPPAREFHRLCVYFHHEHAYLRAASQLIEEHFRIVPLTFLIRCFAVDVRSVWHSPGLAVLTLAISLLSEFIQRRREIVRLTKEVDMITDNINNLEK